MAERIRRLESDAEIFEMAGVPFTDMLSAEARRIYEDKSEDRLALKDVFFEKYLKSVIDRWNDLRREVAGIEVPLSLTPAQLEVLAGYDHSAPEKKMLCVYCFAKVFFERAVERGFNIDLEKLKKASRDNLSGVQRKLQPIREELLKENPDVYFLPRRWKKILISDGELGKQGDFEKDKETGEKIEYGNFVLCQFDDHTLGDQLELALALGIDFNKTEPVSIILAGCGQAGNFGENGGGLDASSHLHCLQIFSGKAIPRKKDGVIVYNRFQRPKLTNLCSMAETYHAAALRLERSKKKREYNSEKPDEIDERSVTDSSSFAFVFNTFSPELDKAVDVCSSESEIKDVIARHLQALSPAELSNVKMFLGENLGDKAEGKTLGRDGNQGKPPGLGPFGGKPEPDDKNIGFNLEKILPPIFFKRTQEDVYFRRLIAGLIREVQNESGYEVVKIYCRIAKISKDKNSHLYHLWLLRLKYNDEGGQTLPVKERREMNPNQLRFWFPLSEVFKITIGGLDAPFRMDRIYYSTIKNLMWFIERLGLSIPDGMNDCKKKMENARKAMSSFH